MIDGVQERGGDARTEGRNASIGGGTKKVANLQEQTTGMQVLSCDKKIITKNSIKMVILTELPSLSSILSKLFVDKSNGMHSVYVTAEKKILKKD
jgi:hypothetical protein